MDGTLIVRAILLARAQIVALVGTVAGIAPPSRVVVGVVPENTPLPAIGITEVVSTDRRTLGGSPGSRVKVTSRVQITVMAASVPLLKPLVNQVRYACRNFNGPIAGSVADVQAHTDGVGPDSESVAGFAMQSVDVHVTFDDIAS